MTPLQSYNTARRATKAGQEGQQEEKQAPGIGTQIGQMFLPQLYSPDTKPPTQEELEAWDQEEEADEEIELAERGARAVGHEFVDYRERHRCPDCDAEIRLSPLLPSLN